MWWSGNDAGCKGLEDEISGNVVEVRRKSDRVMVIMLS